MRAYKGFAADMTCRGFQYAEGETYEHDGDVVACRSGFHAVLSPLDAFGYYSPATSVYHVVELDGEHVANDGDSKVAARKLTVGASIGLKGLAEAHVEYVRANVKPDKKKTAHRSEDCSAASNTGDYSAASNTGDCSAASNTGDCSAASNTGDYSAASNTGNRSAASNTGNCSAASNTGDYSAASNTGDCSAASNTGDYSAASNTGNRSAASNTGNRSAASVSGRESVAIVTGRDSKAAGALGCWLVLTERDAKYHIVEVRAVEVDGEKVEPDTFYALVGGKVVKA